MAREFCAINNNDPMKTKTSLKKVLTLALVSAFLSLAGARANTIAENTAGTSFTSGLYFGQSFTTVTVSPESNIAFNFFSDVPATTPFAIGTGFLLSMEYLGTPSNLSSSTPGFLGQATASGGFYAFNTSLILLPGTQYFFYENALINSPISGGNIYAGGHDYFATSASSNFNPGDPHSANFRVTGILASVPDTSPTLILLAIGLVPAFGIHLRLQRRPHPRS